MNYRSNIQRQSAAGSLGTVCMSSTGTLAVKGKFSIYDGRYKIMELELAYLVIDAQLDRFLFLKTAQKQCTVSLDYEGFQTVYEQLSERFGFDDSLFRKYSRVKKPLKVELWRKIYPANYHILKETFPDAGKGFEIQSPQKKFISWDLPLAELKKEKQVKIKRNSFGSLHLLFAYPVRIGNILLDKLTTIIYCNRTDVPVLQFFAPCYHENNTDQSYWELKKCLEKMGELDSTGGYERADQKHFFVNINGLRLELTYTYDSQYGFDSGSTSFGIYNGRDYDDLLANRDYEATIAISDQITLPDDVHIYGDYKKEKSIRRRPPKLTGFLGEQPAIWKDEKNKKIGFAGKDLSVVYEIKTIRQILIQNTLPAKGGGYSELKLSLKNNRYYKTLMMADCYTFDNCAKAIEELIGKPVKFLPETMNV